jgi:hypothetical protein
MSIYLRDVLNDPGILLRGMEGKKSRAQLREEAEDEMYEALGRVIEEHPIVPSPRVGGPNPRPPKA